MAAADAFRTTSACTQFEVRQDFYYNPPQNGRLSSQETTLLEGTQVREKWTQSYLYDGAGRITQTSYPNCVFIAGSTCPSASRSVTTTYAMGRPIAVLGTWSTDDDFATDINYYDNGMLATIQHVNGVLFTQGPGASGIPRPGYLRASLGTANLWPEESYSYDGAGNIERIGDKSYLYDADSRIVSATIPSAGAQPYQEFRYDKYGNIDRIGRGVDSANPIHVYYPTDANNNHLTSASYNKSGSLEVFLSSSYSWDIFQQMSAVNAGSESWVHTYDAAGERTWSWRTSGSRIDTFALRGQGGEVLRDYTKSGAAYTWEDYVYREGQLLGAGFSDGKVAHFDVDHLGSVRLETYSDGSPAKYRDLWPYGEEATPANGSEEMKFTGHERDLGVTTNTTDDLDYMHARHYRPLFGRFLSVDNGPVDLKRPLNWNRYAYVLGNPTNLTDPSGDVVDLGLLKEEERKRLLASLSALTGDQYGLDDNNHLIVVAFGDRSSKSASLFLREMIGSTDVYKADHKNGDAGVTFMSNPTGSEVWIDFSDFEKIDYGKVPKEAFSLGTTFVHEMLHKVGLDDGPPELWTKHLGPIEEVLNAMREDAGLPFHSDAYAPARVGSRSRMEFTTATGQKQYIYFPLNPDKP